MHLSLEVRRSFFFPLCYLLDEGSRGFSVAHSATLWKLKPVGCHQRSLLAWHDFQYKRKSREEDR